MIATGSMSTNRRKRRGCESARQDQQREDCRNPERARRVFQQRISSQSQGSMTMRAHAMQPKRHGPPPVMIASQEQCVLFHQFQHFVIAGTSSVAFSPRARHGDAAGEAAAGSCCEKAVSSAEEGGEKYRKRGERQQAGSRRRGARRRGSAGATCRRRRSARHWREGQVEEVLRRDVRRYQPGGVHDLPR